MVIDLGAGDGMLGRQLREAIPGLIYVPVERSGAARELLGPDARAGLDEVEPLEGVVIANELFDNVPFHLMRDGREVVIDAEAGRLVERTAETTIKPRQARSEDVPVLGEQASELIHRLAKVLRRGYVFVLDYGFAGDEPVEPIRGYSGNRSVDDLLARPGETDITGPVDFDALAEVARAAGFQTHGPVTQRDSLMALGYREALDDMARAQKEAEGAGEWRAAIEIFNARGEASMVVDPAGLGSLKVLAMATEGLPRPRLVPVP
jgi:NADH dehydrogenase [ubiquinone] 1 alpha subcomplex assembly factor 7